MANYLIDASALIDWLKGKRAAIGLFRNLIRDGHILALNAIAGAEVYSGLSDDERGPADRISATLDYWPIDVPAARLAGSLRYACSRQGRPLSVPDTLMTAQAITGGAILPTGNARDFPMPELRVEKIPPA